MSRKLSYLFFGLSALMFASVFGGMLTPKPNRPSELSGLFSYAVGQLLIPYVLMIIAIYFFKKSQRDAPKKIRRRSNMVIIGLNLLLLLFYCVLVFFAQAFSSITNLPPDGLVHNDAYKNVVCPDFLFTIPDGWTRTRPDRKKTAVVLVKFGSTMDEVLAMIKIEVGRPVDENCIVAAEGLAVDWGGEVVDPNAQVDGVKAVSISSDYKGGQLQPVKGVIVFRDGKIYMIMGGVSVDEDISDEMDDIVSSWKWR